MKGSKKIFIACFWLFLSLACAPHRVWRLDAAQSVDLSGAWNDTDSRLVAEEMTRQIMEARWHRNFYMDYEREPVVIVGFIQNKTHEHIDTDTFVKDIERVLIESRRVRLVQNAALRDKVREERLDQQNFASPATQKQWGKELGADFMLLGSISSVVDVERRSRVIYYQVNLQLTNIETNEVVWIGKKEIKKFVKN